MEKEMTFGEANKICADYGITCARFDEFKNARVILAHQEKAGKLLEACRFALAYIVSGDISREGALNTIRAAIQKAEGSV